MRIGLSHGGFLVAAVVAGVGCSDGAKSMPPPAMIADPYTLSVFDKTHITSNSAGPNYQHALGDVDFHDGPFATVTMVVDLTSPCYPFSNWKTTPPPAGQSWPAACDAFDRNFEITLDPAAADGKPGFELMRAITPFGGPEHQEIDLTDVANGLPGKHALDVFITTYSDAAGKVSGSAGGWDVSVHIDVTPGTAPHHVLAAIPLIDGNLHTGEMPPLANLMVPAGTTSTRLEYRVTGHGGANDPSNDCIGPAEEFCQRTHHVTVDGAELEAFMPWREDCDQLCTLTAGGPGGAKYCLQNPCGAVASVKAPRANWCPGSLTPPKTWDPPALHTAGSHTFTYAVDNEYPDGVWRVSAAFFAFGD